LTVQSNATPAPQGAYNSVVGDCGAQCGANQCCNDRYLTIFGGAASFNDIGFDLALTAPGGAQTGLSAIVEQNDGWTVGGAIGKRLSRRVRGEVEWSYRNASLNSASVVLNGVPLANAALDGQLNAYRSTSNLLFDMNPGGRINMYFGGGVGVGVIDLDATEPTAPNATNPPTPITARLETSTFVYQGIVGISARIKPCAELFVDYRYTGTDHIEINTTSPIGTTNLDVDITSNDIYIGIRFWR
jgi:opacity protein-like surface antigen